MSTTVSKWLNGNHDLHPQVVDFIFRAFMHFYARQYPNISRIYSAGKSVEERDLWVMEISGIPFN